MKFIQSSGDSRQFGFNFLNVPIPAKVHVHMYSKIFYAVSLLSADSLKCNVIFSFFLVNKV